MFDDGRYHKPLSPFPPERDTPQKNASHPKPMTQHVCDTVCKYVLKEFKIVCVIVCVLRIE